MFLFRLIFELPKINVFQTIKISSKSSLIEFYINKKPAGNI